MRLVRAVGYGGESKKYNGFYPQLVASTYQWRAYQERKLSFEEAQVKYSFSGGKESFKNAYATYAKIMNEILGVDMDLYPESEGYFQDFSGLVDIEHIQAFLVRVGSALQEDLFNQPPLEGSALNYSDTSEYCE